MGLCVFSLAIPLAMIERICIYFFVIIIKSEVIKQWYALSVSLYSFSRYILDTGLSISIYVVYKQGDMIRFSLCQSPNLFVAARNTNAKHRASELYHENTLNGFWLVPRRWKNARVQDQGVRWVIVTNIPTWASCQIRKIVGCACAGNSGNVCPTIAGQRSRHASRHVCDARAVMHAGIAN